MSDWIQIPKDWGLKIASRSYERGKKDERERIIKLLEELRTEFVNLEHCHEVVVVEGIMGLIKEQNK